MAAPLGNQNAKRGRIWRNAIERALDRRDKCRTDGIKEIDALADKLLDLVSAGDLVALKEFGDRLEGKPVQAIAGDDEAPPIRVEKIGLVDLSDDSPDSTST